MKEVHWQIRETIVVLLVPFELAVAAVFGLAGFDGNTTLSTILSVVLRVVTTCQGEKNSHRYIWDYEKEGICDVETSLCAKQK